jgi:hypothetical protein
MDTDDRPSTQRRPFRVAPVAAAALLTVWFALGVAVADASPSSPGVEGIWSFNGGEIAVQPEGNGKFEGVVVQPTRFAACTHPDGQKIWTEMTPQPDGSYWGFHQWYKTISCPEQPDPGPTAWRVIGQPNGARYLRVCLSSPGGGQPTIPSGSSGIGASYGCQSSSLTAPLSSGLQGFNAAVSLPSAKKCLSVRKFAIHIHNPKYDPFKSVTVTLRSHRVRVTRHRGIYQARIDLKGLPRGAFTVKIKAVTFRGHRFVKKRTYHTCTKGTHKREPGKPK